MQQDDNFKDLREKAERLLDNTSNNSENYSLRSIKAMIQELQIHQIELELQNEELRLSQLRLKESEVKYYEFYNNAPIGFMTLNDDEKVIEANMMIGEIINLDKRAIIANEFIIFVHKDFRDQLYFFLNKLRESNKRIDEEFLLLRKNLDPVWVSISGKYLRDGINQFRLAITDITYQKKLETELIKYENQNG